MVLMDGFVQSSFPIQSTIYSEWENRAQFIYNESLIHIKFFVLSQYMKKFVNQVYVLSQYIKFFDGYLAINLC
jgi:hypothetical protein